eukprot:Ihof_evm1s1157 gene=Ihof_evmTU1s1157
MGQLDRLIVVGLVDITKTRLQLIVVDPFSTHQEQAKRTPGTILVDVTLQHDKYNDFAEVMEGFIEEIYLDDKGRKLKPRDISVACLAVPGPVHTNSYTLNNANVPLNSVSIAQHTGLVDRDSLKDNGEGWILDKEDLQRRLRIRTVHLVNDFLVVGYSLLTLARQETVTLQDAPSVPHAPMAVIGTGRGLGQCYLTYHNEEYTVWPSEGGHCEFAPKTELQVDLLCYLKSRHNESHRISVERVVSSHGLETVYDFLSEKYSEIRDNQIHRAIQESKDRPATITTLSSTDKLCYKAMEILIWTYGSEAGCAALKWLPYGGLFIAGDMAPRNIQRLQSDTTFIDAYYDKGRVNPLMRQ